MMNTPIQFTQNFLHNQQLVNKLVYYANLKPGDQVIEIGPGKGIITKMLAAEVGSIGSVIAIEYDQRLADNLRVQNTLSQVKIIQQDALEYSFSKQDIIVANVPFTITADLLLRLFHPKIGVARAYLILEKAALIATTPDQKKAETLKSLLIRPWYELKLLYTFQRSDFVPAPHVETGFFSFIRKQTPDVSVEESQLYFDYIAFISKDRVGEGGWLRIFSKKQLAQLAQDKKITLQRGLKAQTYKGILEVFQFFVTFPKEKQRIVKGAFSQLKSDQAKRQKINTVGNHHRKTSIEKG